MDGAAVEHREPDVRKRRADTVSYVVAVGARSSPVGYTLSQGDLRSIAISAEQVGSLTRPHGGHANSAKDFALFPRIWNCYFGNSPLVEQRNTLARMSPFLSHEREYDVENM
jgi:hypothetical protein